MENPWLPIMKWELNPERPSSLADPLPIYNTMRFSGLDYELLHIPTGKIKAFKRRNIYDHEGVIDLTYTDFWVKFQSGYDEKGRYWDNCDDPLNNGVASEYNIRMKDKQFQTLVFVKENIQVGDFVRFKASRTYAWRKVVSIGDWSVYGQCASEPNDASLVLHSSENPFCNVVEIIRDGVKIL